MKKCKKRCPFNYAALKNNSDKSFMLRHINAEHVNEKEEVNFTWKILKKFHKPLQRQIFEANTINNMSENVLLNSKQEFNHLNTKKLQLRKPSEKTFQCNTCGGRFGDSSSLTEHNEKFHKYVQCSSCSYKAIGTTDLKYHSKNFHSTKH